MRWKRLLLASPRSQTPVWERPSSKLRFVSRHSLPVRDYLHQPRPARIVTRAGIAPVHGFIDIAALDRVVVHVLQLLAHHVPAPDLFGVAALLPELVVARGLVAQLQGAQLSEQDLRPVALQQVKALPR